MNARTLALALRSTLAVAMAVWCSTTVWAQPTAVQASHPFAQSRLVPGRYIVVFKDSVSNPSAEVANAMRAGGQLHHVYSVAIKGFAATLPDAAVQALRNNPQVAYVEQDQTVSLVQVQDPATWGLDRIDQADRPLDGLYHYGYTGSGVTAFIIDTGIRADHVEFSGRVLTGYNTVPDSNGTNDCNGHGTHVAGTVGGVTWGVGRQLALVPVRVLDCRGSGSWSGVIAGIDWVANTTPRPAVANMSLGGGASTSVNAAVAGAVQRGVTMVVAAGNSNADACNYSPSSEPSAITVGATTSGDARSSYSNYGACVDVFAPGSSITSAWNTSNVATNTISGTSMASPHVTGVAALAAQANPGASPAAIASFLIANATANRLSSTGGGSPNLLIYSLVTGGATEPTTPVIAVGSLTGNSVKNGKNWRGQAAVGIRNVASSAAMAGAMVNGSFSPGGSASCVTGTSGSCTLSSAVIPRATSSTVLTITGVSDTNMIYDASQNSASQITITSP